MSNFWRIFRSPTEQQLAQQQLNEVNLNLLTAQIALEQHQAHVNSLFVQKRRLLAMVST